MREFKMSNWFKTPVDCSLVCDDTDIDDSCDTISIDGHVILTGHHVEKVEIAINQHDMLTEQNKILREALKRISEWDNMSQEFRLDHGSKGQQRVIVDIATKALEQSKS